MLLSTAKLFACFTLVSTASSVPTPAPDVNVERSIKIALPPSTAQTSRHRQPNGSFDAGSAFKSLSALMDRHGRRHAPMERRVAESRKPRKNQRSRIGSTSVVLPITDFGGDAAYFGTISIGTPPQQLNTGSSDLVLPVAALNGNAAFFNLAKSSTAVQTQTSLTLNYGNGDASGTIASDTVTIAGLTVPNQTFVAVTSTTYQAIDAADTPIQGILGLAFQAMARTMKPTFIDNLISKHSLSANLFGVYLGREPQADLTPINSELMIGAFNREHIDGALTILPVTSQTFWVLGTSFFAVDGRAVRLLRGPPLETMIDTGSEYIILPRSTAKQVWANFPGATFLTTETVGGHTGDVYQYPCASTNIISITFQGSMRSFTIDPRDLSFGPVLPGSEMCAGALVGGDFPAGSPGANVGAPFLKSWYSIYQQNGNGSPTIRFGKSK
ncbi:hypothetical protein P7C70_g6467, partial [Phenoliferia sp. Uapishka_3]